jgi:metallophosphoesterase (TIGR00282 family)
MSSSLETRSKLIGAPAKGELLRVLMLGDVVGRPGRAVIAAEVGTLRRTLAIDLVIANGENAAGGAGIDAGTALDLRKNGVDLITLGDHTFQRKGSAEFLSSHAEWCIRPFNFPQPVTPGRGWCRWVSPTGVPVFVCNMIGRVFLQGPYECPFRGIDRCLEQIAAPAHSIIICDFHAEATSEKWAMARYVDGRLSLLVGTHTHVQTADHQILPGGTAYITDLGMTGSPNGVIGMCPEVALKRFLAPLPAPYEVAPGDGVLRGVLVDFDPYSGRPRWIGLV